jgi:hypothetical protein
MRKRKRLLPVKVMRKKKKKIKNLLSQTKTHKQDRLEDGLTKDRIAKIR